MGLCGFNRMRREQEAKRLEEAKKLEEQAKEETIKEIETIEEVKEPIEPESAEESSEEKIRQQAKALGIKSWHVKNIDKLIKEIEEVE